jgi:hypothetical protein
MSIVQLQILSEEHLSSCPFDLLENNYSVRLATVAGVE